MSRTRRVSRGTRGLIGSAVDAALYRVFDRTEDRSSAATRSVVEPLEKRTLLSISVSGIPNWIAEGPAPNTNGQDETIPGPPNNPVSGAIEAVAIDPGDPNTVYVGGANGGVWKTTNENANPPSWTPLTDQFPSLQTSAIQFDPTDSTNQTVVAGIGGTSNCCGFSIGAFGGQTVDALTGLLKTTDGGSTWAQLGNAPLASGGLQGLSVSAVGPRGNTILVATHAGMYLSTNGGGSFQNISGANNLNAGPVFDLAADPSNNNRFYAVVGGGNPGVFRTDNLGGTWTNVTNAAVTAVFNTNPGITNAKLSVSAAAGNAVFLAITDNTSQLAGVFRATDAATATAPGGATWTAMDLPRTLDAPRTITNASNATPIVITTSANHGYANGDRVRIGGVTGNTAANGDWTISVSKATPNQFTLIGSAGNGNYTGAGMANNLQGILHGRQAYPNLALGTDPGNGNLVYIAGDRQDYLGGDSSIGANAFSGRIFRGDASVAAQGPGAVVTDATHQWTPLTNSGTSNNSSPHADSRTLEIDGSNLIYSGDGGIFLENSPHNTAGVWTSLNGNLQVTQFYNISYDSVFHVIMGGAQDTGTPAQTAPGSATYSDQTQADGPATFIDNLTSTTQSIRYLGLTRRVFSNPTTTVGPDVGVFPTGGLTVGTVTFTNVGPVALNSIAPPAAQSTRLVIGVTAPMVANGAVFESTNAGVAPNTASVTWTQVLTGAGFVTGNAIAAGGRLGGVNNPDVLYVASGSQIFLRTTAGGTLNATAAQPVGAGTITSIALDPNNWRTAFVTDGVRVFMTTDAGGTWTNVTGNLSNSTFRFGPQLAVIGGAGVDAVLFGGQTGVVRMLTTNPGVWTKFGAGLPNVYIGGMQYNAADDVLVVGTFGRGAWEVASASTTAFTPGVLQVNGDTDFPGENDTFKLVLDPVNPLLLDVYLNSTSPIKQVQFSTLSQINVNGLAGNDTLIVDDTNGLISVPSGINYDGGTGFNSLQLVQTDGPARTSDTYSVGPDNGSGTDVISDASGTQSIFFQNLAPVLDTVPAVSFTVNATPSNNAINLSQGSVPANGRITIDNFEPVEFSKKQGVTINSLAGQDTININDPSTPTSLAQLTVNGGDPNAGDQLLVNGVGATVGINTSTNMITGALGTGGGVPISYSGVEALNVTAGLSTTLAVSGSTTYSYTPAVALDGGLLQTDQIPISFTGLGAGKTLAVTGSGILPHALVVNGTAGQDTFTAAAGGDVTLTGRATIHPSSVSTLTLNGLGGNDIFNLSANQPYAGITIAGGGGGTANLNGNGPAISAMLGPTTSVTGGGLGSLTLTGNATINLNAAAGALSVSGSAGPDSFAVTVGSPNALTAQDGPFSPTLNATTTGNLTLTGVASSLTNSLSLQTHGAASVGYQPQSASSGVLTVTGGPTVTLGNIESLTYDGQSGGAALTVNGGGGNAFTYNPGAANDSGTLAMDSTLPILFQHLGASGTLTVVDPTGSNSLVYNDPAANDAFTVNNGGVGGQINLNSRVPVFTSGIQTLTLNGLNGGDSFTLVPAISSSVYTMLNFNGGGTGTASLIGTTSADSFVVSGQSVSLGGHSVKSTGMQNILLNGNGGADLVTYNGVVGVSENINVIGSTTANAGQISIPGVLLLTFTAIPNIQANGDATLGSGDTDTLTFTGTNNSDVYQINLAAAGTPSDPILKLEDSTGTNTLLTLVNYSTSFSTLNINGLDGADVFNVFTAPTIDNNPLLPPPPSRNLFINGGIPNGKKKLTDLLNVFYVMPRPKIVHSTQTQNPNSGLVSLAYDNGVTDLIQFTQIENVVIRKM